MSSRQIYSLVHFDGWVMPDRIEQGSTYRAWTNMNKAVKKGALWGDFAVYTAQELYETVKGWGNDFGVKLDIGEKSTAILRRNINFNTHTSST